jgi:hypothetical protein
MLSERVKAAIRQVCEDSYAEQREQHTGNEYAQANIDALVSMMYDLKLRTYEADGPILAVIWEEAYVDGSLYGLGPLAKECPYVGQ